MYPCKHYYSFGQCIQTNIIQSIKVLDFVYKALYPKKNITLRNIIQTINITHSIILSILNVGKTEKVTVNCFFFVIWQTSIRKERTKYHHI